jgi:hypothetical protein
LLEGDQKTSSPKKKTFNYGKENHNTISIDPHKHKTYDPLAMKAKESSMHTVVNTSMCDFDLRSTYGTDQTHFSNPHKGVFAKKTIKECSPIVVRDFNPQCMSTKWCTPLGRVHLLLSCKTACHNVRGVKAFLKCHRVTWSSPMQALLINCGHVSMIKRL